MCFEHLNEANKRNELLLLDGGMCRFHLRKDGQLTIHEIISQQPGTGQKMLGELKTKGATSLFAKCSVAYQSNEWYRRRGFILEKVETLKSGTQINHWRLWN